MLRWQTLTGAVIGLITGFTVLALTGSSLKKPSLSGPILSECDGHFRELIIQYDPSAAGIVTNAYRDFLGALEGDVIVNALCPTREAFDDLLSRVGPTRCKITPIVTAHPITTWARDRWVALEPSSPGEPTTIWSPLGEAGAEAWPARAGDEKVGADIARALGNSVVARRSRLYFDGGDFLVDQTNVFVMPRVLSHNIQHTVTNRQEFLVLLARETKRHVILLDVAPDHHAGMFMASPGNGVMLVADPGLGKKLLSDESSQAAMDSKHVVTSLPSGPDFSLETQRLFDAVASQCMAAGYKVVRIPVIPARDGRTFLTYVNVLMDQQEEQRLVYLPWYRGCEGMNVAAQQVWKGLGYKVRPVNCTDTYRHFGCLHCLVNVLSRTPVTPHMEKTQKYVARRAD